MLTEKNSHINLFIPCCMDKVYPQTASNLYNFLTELGLEVNYNIEQTCCGKTLFKNGYWKEAKEVGEKFIKEFNNNQYTVCPSASCVAYVKNYFDFLFYNTGLHLENKKIKENIIELSDFLVNILQVDDINATFNHKITYHDSCSALREYGLYSEPRILLSKVKGLEFVEMDRTDKCCGMGDMFALNFMPISTSMVAEKIEHAMDTKAEYIVSTDASCLLNMETFIKKNNLPLKCIHLADILASKN
ncbi:Fe-S oxidoreductase [Bacteroidia bacterium]|nr:Fe-S oxidoreductase [Bacteroidia bacterium]